MSDGLRLISAAIATGSASALIAAPASMFEEAERPVHDFVRGYYRQYRTLPQVQTVFEETRVRLPTANEPIAFYVDRFYERHEYNQIRDRFGSLREAMTSFNIAQARETIRELSRTVRQSGRRGLEVVDLAQAAELVQERLNQTRGYGGVTGVETAWRGFDNITGGYQRGDLISFVGRPALGKTYTLLRQAWMAHQAGHSVLFVTTEMSAEQIARRHSSIALGINPTHLKTNMISTYTQRRIREFYRGMAGVDTFRIFSVGMNSRVAAIDAFAQEFGPDIIFLDGAYLMYPSQGGRSQTRTERITGVFDELKALTLEANMPMVVSTQFSRAAGKGGAEGSLENIGYTDAIGTHSSIIVAVRYGPTTNPKASRWLSFLKGREGEEGRVAINFKFAPLDMDEFVPDGETPAEEGHAQAPSANVNWMV